MTILVVNLRVRCTYLVAQVRSDLQEKESSLTIHSLKLPHHYTLNVGGGSCFDPITCFHLEDPTAEPSPESWEGGILDSNDLRNPYQNWTIVAIAYCTGDLYAGETVTSILSGRIHFVGRTNTKTVLSWVHANMASPERVFIAGCSAGAFGIQFWIQALVDHYQGLPQPPVTTVLADSYVGTCKPSQVTQYLSLFICNSQNEATVPNTGARRFGDATSLLAHGQSMETLFC